MDIMEAIGYDANDNMRMFTGRTSSDLEARANELGLNVYQIFLDAGRKETHMRLNGQWFVFS